MRIHKSSRKRSQAKPHTDTPVDRTALELMRLYKTAAGGIAANLIYF